MNHKKEPWSYKANGKYAQLLDSKGWAIGAGDYDGVVSFGLDCARRIVACVNACAGIGTESLERFNEQHKPKNGFGLHRESKLEAQRDELQQEVDGLQEIRERQEREIANMNYKASAAQNSLADALNKRDELLAALKHAEYNIDIYSSFAMKNYLKDKIAKCEAQS